MTTLKPFSMPDGNISHVQAGGYRMRSRQPQPGGGGGVFIEDEFVLAERNWMVGQHQLGLNSVGGWTGVTDEAGFTQVTATSAAEMVSAMNNSPSSLTIVNCAWNGVNTLGTGAINGPSDTALTSAGFANPAADNGFDIPPLTTMIRAAPGFSPVLGNTGAGTALFLRGWNRIHIEGLTFEGQVFLDNISGRPLLAIAVIKHCVLPSVSCARQRLLHLDGCIFRDANALVSAPSDFVRLHRNIFTGKNRNGDLIRASGYSGAHQVGKRANIWIAGNVMHSSVFDIPSENHFDMFQWTGGDTSILGHNILCEFNLFNANIRASQGIFGDDNGSDKLSRFVAHNNLITITAFHAITPEGKSGNDRIAIYRNTCVRAGGASDSQTTSATIRIWEGSEADPQGVGEYLIAENLANGISTAAANLPIVLRDNVLVSPNAQDTILTGNGTWAVNGIGEQTYDDPGNGLDDASAVQAIRDFYRPIGGYRANNAGMTDPLTWPSDIPVTL